MAESVIFHIKLHTSQKNTSLFPLKQSQNQKKWKPSASQHTHTKNPTWKNTKKKHGGENLICPLRRFPALTANWPRALGGARLKAKISTSSAKDERKWPSLEQRSKDTHIIYIYTIRNIFYYIALLCLYSCGTLLSSHRFVYDATTKQNPVADLRLPPFGFAFRIEPQILSGGSGGLLVVVQMMPSTCQSPHLVMMHCSPSSGSFRLKNPPPNKKWESGSPFFWIYIMFHPICLEIAERILVVQKFAAQETSLAQGCSRDGSKFYLWHKLVAIQTVWWSKIWNIGHQGRTSTPPETNMEPNNHPIEKENHLPNLHF